MDRNIEKIIIHCAYTPNGKAFDISDIDYWHKQRGFKRASQARENHLPHISSCGYHHVITLDGDIQQGRAHSEIGAHVKGHNTDSIGICMIGSDQFTMEQWQALRVLVSGLLALYPESELYGHRDFNPHKTCPCFDVEHWFNSGMIPDPEHLLAKGEDTK